MKSKLSALLILFTNVLACSAQRNDSLKILFIQSDFFNNVIVKQFESYGDSVYLRFGGKTYVNDFCFKNLLTNHSYEVEDTGIWKVGINSSHPQYYLLFRYNKKNHFEYCNSNKILLRYNDYLKFVNLTETEKLIILYKLIIYLNECFNYPLKIQH